MSIPYGIISDVHLHKWSAFAQTDANGMNSRLAGLLSEITRAAATVERHGGDTLIVSGDLFHVRGQLSPSVLNPTMDCFRSIVQNGINVHIIPGNHDLEGRDSDRVGSAVTALEGAGCCVHYGSEYVLSESEILVVPWIESVASLKGELERICQDKAAASEDWSKTDLIIHAPVNGVIMGIPDHGLEPGYLAALGFKRVFAGHYHNHVSFPGQVYSVGALAHHTWSDVGTQAGFLLVYENQVDFHPSGLPKFVDVHETMDAAEVRKAVIGNYARVKVETSKVADIDAMRDFLTKSGALGTMVISVKTPVQQRTTGVTVKAGASIETSVSEFIKGMTLDNPAAVETGALRILSQAEITA